MREKELRIALVFFGGVSLAVYMHGICKEVLKLLRASAALHRITDRTRRAEAKFFDSADPNDPEYDTEAEYFELLRDIGRKLELRTIVDVIAGASAGGINATMLARALCHDLPTLPLRDLWLGNADVAVLLAPEARAGTWSKAILKPFIWGAAAAGMFGAIRDKEVRRNVSLFVRSRWFKPPFSGPVMAGLMYDAAVAMGSPQTPAASLLPSGHGLDLFVTLTDYYGYRQLVEIHDPAVIYELEHRHVLHFKYRRRPSGAVESDFDLDNAAALAFAARATSSFPGAFPPAQIVEMDALVASRGAKWPRREEFILRNFQRHLRADSDPATASFIDGAVLNNRPFRDVVAAIRARSAYRDVDRRLVFVDANPAAAALIKHTGVPNFFSTIKGALSDLPSGQPVANELTWVNNLNAQVRGIRSIIEGARPHVSSLVGNIIDNNRLDRRFSEEDICGWREDINARVVREAGFAHEGYARLKLAAVRGFVARMIVICAGEPLESPLARVVEELINAWAAKRGIVYQAAESEALKHETAVRPELPSWVEFLLAFDVDYRRRRLHFLIEGQNRLYRMLDETHFSGLDPAAVDRLKRAFYLRLDQLRRCEEPSFFSGEVHSLAQHLFETMHTAMEIRNPEIYALEFAASAKIETIDRLVEALRKEIDLNASTRDLDELLASIDPAEWPPDAHREILINYLGFPFWDVLTFPVIGRDMSEFQEILVDRISPEEAQTLKEFSGAKSLKGAGFENFAGFFSRSYRENDYLLGRLHGLDRLIDIVCDAAGVDRQHDGIDILDLKRRAFERILDAEAPHLMHSAALIAALRRSIAQIGNG